MSPSVDRAIAIQQHGSRHVVDVQFPRERIVLPPAAEDVNPAFVLVVLLEILLHFVAQAVEVHADDDHVVFGIRRHALCRTHFRTRKRRSTAVLCVRFGGAGGCAAAARNTLPVIRAKGTKRAARR